MRMNINGARSDHPCISIMSKRSFLAATFLLLTGAAWLRAEVLSGGSFSMPFPFASSGGSGNGLSGANFSLMASIGQFGGTPMRGGTFQLAPGLYGSQSAAQANLDSAHAFPTPFKPSLGHDRITFRGLTTNATVKIYTVSGELVQTLSKSDGLTQDLIWYPVANSAGEAVASGVYLYVVRGDSKASKGKIMIIK